MSVKKLTMTCEHGGCAAKASAEELDRIVSFWQVAANTQVGSGLKEKDDVATYDFGGEELLLHSIDVITPVVDDGFQFGAISVSHALSDIYARGGVPISALSFLGISESIASSVQEIVAGCSSKLAEAGVTLLGGHTISSQEPLVGFAVTGVVRKEELVPLSGAKRGNKLVLTKPIGSGIISTALKFSHFDVENAFLTESELLIAERSMALLNRYASKAMHKYHVTACTDITGFGLAGHVSHMARASKVGARIFYHRVSQLPGVTRLFQHSVIPVRLDENVRYYYGERVKKTTKADVDWPILFCPETSGGLLMAVADDDVQQLIDRLNAVDGVSSIIIGEIIDDPSYSVIIDD